MYNYLVNSVPGISHFSTFCIPSFLTHLNVLRLPILLPLQSSIIYFSFSFPTPTPSLFLPCFRSGSRIRWNLYIPHNLRPIRINVLPHSQINLRSSLALSSATYVEGVVKILYPGDESLILFILTG
jgi:hypothetical protein